MKLDRDGYLIATALLCIAVIFRLISVGTGFSALTWCSWAAVIFMVFSLWFFRDPERSSSDDVATVVSAADGVVVDVSVLDTGEFGEGQAWRIAVFMNVFNVHVNRAPISGTVLNTVHRNGKKLSAYNKRAEYENEHGDCELDTPYGMVRIRQIAGLIARRVVTRVHAGDVLEKGDRIGIIRFGSRVDVFLPLAFEPLVTTGMKVKAGETITARLKA